jgi:antitoxin ChpS
MTYILKYIRSEIMFQTKIRKVGNSSVVTISAEMLAALDAKDGDTVYVTRSDDNGLKILAHDPTLLAALAAAEDVMDENRTLLQALA